MSVPIMYRKLPYRLLQAPPIVTSFKLRVSYIRRIGYYNKHITTTLRNYQKNLYVRQKYIIRCDAASSDNYYYDPKNSSNNSNSLSKEEEELVKHISSLEPFNRTYVKQHVSLEAMDAIQKTASGMLGMLPAHQFQIHIKSTRDPLANLLFSSLCTGYALKNAEFRLQLQTSIEATETDSEDLFRNEAVLSLQQRSNLSPEVRAYIESLESRLLKVKEAECHLNLDSGHSTGNRLLHYVRSMNPESVNKLSESAGHGVIQGFNLTVKKLVESLHASQPYPSSSKLLGKLRSALGETEKISSNEQSFSASSGYSLGKFHMTREGLTDAILWSMLVGYYTKGLEYRMILERSVYEEKSEEKASERAWFLRLGSLFNDEESRHNNTRRDWF